MRAIHRNQIKEGDKILVEAEKSLLMLEVIKNNSKGLAVTIEGEPSSKYLLTGDQITKGKKVQFRSNSGDLNLVVKDFYHKKSFA